MYLHEKRFIIGMIAYRPSGGSNAVTITAEKGGAPIYGNIGKVSDQQMRKVSGKVVVAKVEAISVYFPDDRQVVIQEFTLIDIKPISDFMISSDRSDYYDYNLYTESDGYLWGLPRWRKSEKG